METTGMEQKEKQGKYNSTVNVIGGVPDYMSMIDFINRECGYSSVDNFSFRTAKATSRFKKAVVDAFILFESERHKTLFLEALNSNEYSNEEKMIIMFWQFLFCNRLFAEITDNVFLRALYSGRTSISAPDVEAYMKHLKAKSPDDMTWSDSTIKTTASKYLTVLKKFGFADGKIQKTIRAPHISSSLFIYLVKFALSAYPEDNALTNPMFRFSFLDRQSIINRLKTIECIPLWNITQIGNEITITLK